MKFKISLFPGQCPISAAAYFPEIVYHNGKQNGTVLPVLIVYHYREQEISATSCLSMTIGSCSGSMSE